jgi:hypothetical protein
MDSERPIEEKMKCDECGSIEGTMFINREKVGPQDPTWLCGKHRIAQLETKLDASRRLLTVTRLNSEPMFPISTSESDYKPHPISIPWSVAEMAYSVYAQKFGTGQSLKHLAERGGFGPSEMDEFYPGWMEAAAEVIRLRNNLVDARADLVERDQEVFILNSRLRVMAQSFDELAAAVGWTKERCNQAGDSPMDVARELMRDVVDQKSQLTRARAELDVAVRKIAELTKGEGQ